ncbi:hypothetical protein B6D29_04640 [Microgenomates bacterium UTCPR1]|nr:MAG: hypothetical protein B6D29_04640 [Microgenomates bacterium UTCPR1]
MTRNITVKDVKKAELIINNQHYDAANVKIEKLGQPEPIKPLTGANPDHPARFQMHATLSSSFNISSLIGIELPRVVIIDDQTRGKSTLSQVVITDCRDNEIKITATHFTLSPKTFP